MPTQILNIDDLEYQPWSHGDRFDAQMGAISAKIGAQKLGYNVTVLAPGKRAFPFHSHRVNEEMFFILEGAGEVRIGDETHPVRTGDVVACPPGGRATARQFINTSETKELKYLAVSTMMWPEIAEYPDSDKTGVLANFPAQGDGKPEAMRFIIRGQADMADYWDGE